MQEDLPINKTKKDNRKGSILILMTCIILIAAIYITTALFDVRGTVDQERIQQTQSQIDVLKNAVIDYRRNNPTIPLSNYAALVSKPGTMSSCNLSYNGTLTTMQVPSGWCGPYLDTSNFLATTSAYQVDGWNTGFQLSSTGSAGSYLYTIKSCGPDTVCNNSDDLTLGF